jgi:chromosome segregation ATPase
MKAACVLLMMLAPALAEKASGSAVQKVIELLDDMKAKITSDLEAESAAMEEYLSFCDGETKEKIFAIKTADSSIADLSAIIEESKATIAAKDDEVATLGTVISDKTKELDAATKVREAENADFVAAEKELMTSVDECSRAAVALEKGLSLLQMRGGHKGKARKALKKQLAAVENAMKTILSAAWVEASSARKLKSLLQQASTSADGDDLSLSLHQPQAKQVAYESKSGVIVDAIKEMQKKAEGELSSLRKTEMSAAHEFKMLEQALKSEITHSQESLGAASKTKAQAAEDQAKAEGDLVEVTKTKASDQEYQNTLRGECEAKATEWEARQKSAKGEMGALDKAKTILADGVKAFVQVKAKVHRRSFEDADEQQDVRARISHKLDALGRKYHSFAFLSLASLARSDPFVKIRGLIEEMIASLLKQAEEEATQKAFCDTEMGKSKKSKADKESKIDKFQARIDKASSALGELKEAVKDLEAEIGEIDKAGAEATKIRTEENADNVKAMKDFKDSADAVISAIGVLKSFYEGGAFIQLGSRTRVQSRAKQPAFGAANSDAGGSIIAVLEVAEEDFTRLYAEVDQSENEAADAYEKLTTENKISKATKGAEVKGKLSEIKGLEVQLEQAKEDHSSTSAELDAVLAYLDKLKPQCETKVMSYEEKTAKRNAEIEGLKEALSILEGTGVALLDTRRFRGI